MYFDLEFPLESRAEAKLARERGDGMVDAIIGLTQEEVDGRWRKDEGGEGLPLEVIELDSSTSTKWSRHLILRLPRGRW